MWLASDSNMAAAVVQMCLGYRGILAVRSRVGATGALGLVSLQLRAFSVRKEPQLDENPYYGKYRDKIQRLSRSDAAASVDRMEKRKDVEKQPLASSKQAEYVRSVEEKVGSRSLKQGFTKKKMLNSLLNLELVKDKSAADITQIWNNYFSTKDAVYSVIPGETFQLVLQRAQTCPSFLYALPRKEGYEFFMGQWSGTELHFTALLNIQTAGEAAPSQLILYHYNELQKDKGIVLMTSEHDSKFLSVQDGQCLANQVQLFYAGDMFKLVETFNHNSSDFKYMSVVSILEQNGLGGHRGDL
ncbi:ATP synthase mitochondrial F1 complex assembly factor 1 [Mixophyes fleayi]|uniref:ATP synthase mitochondrial F1 complex assembly factor 1 n=1 Tax=Mixophyes fleayi TaxID=3061075 RepID=UPI003F4E2856